MNAENKSNSTVQPFNDSTFVEKCCGECGKYGVIEIGDQFLCEECIALAGCACGASGLDEKN